MSVRSALRWGTHPTGLAGAFLGATVVAAQPTGTGVVGLVFGWAYGMVVGALIRLFRVPPGAYPLVGLLAGPLPFAVFMGGSTPPDGRGVLAVGLLAGLVLGLVEWAGERYRARRDERMPDAS